MESKISSVESFVNANIWSPFSNSTVNDIVEISKMPFSKHFSMVRSQWFHTHTHLIDDHSSGKIRRRNAQSTSRIEISYGRYELKFSMIIRILWIGLAKIGLCAKTYSHRSDDLSLGSRSSNLSLFRLRINVYSRGMISAERYSMLFVVVMRISSNYWSNTVHR